MNRHAYYGARQPSLDAEKRRLELLLWNGRHPLVVTLAGYQHMFKRLPADYVRARYEYVAGARPI